MEQQENGINFHQNGAIVFAQATSTSITLYNAMNARTYTIEIGAVQVCSAAAKHQF